MHFPKSPILLLALTLGLLASPVSAQTLLVDFGGNGTTTFGAAPADDPVNYWNNVLPAVGHSNTGQLNALVTSTNAVTPINLVMVSRFNGVNEQGLSDSGIFPNDATRDSMYGNTENFGAGSNFFPSFKLTGLGQTENHSLTFYASRGGVTDNRETLYTVVGATTETVSLNASANLANTVTAPSIKPDANGEITITLGPGPNNNNANHFTYLGVLKVQIVPVQQPIVFTTEPADLTVRVGHPATFTAVVNSSPPYTIQWKEGVSDIPGANQFSYTIPAVDLSMNNTKYSVTVANQEFTGNSRQATLTVIPDNTAPTLVSGSGTAPFQLSVVFSEEVEELSAKDPNNYILDGGNNFASSLQLLPDRKTVVITPLYPVTSSLVVEVMNVTDLAQNPLAAGATVNIATPPQPDGKSFLIDFGGGDATLRGGGNNDPLNAWNNVSATLGGSPGGVLGQLQRNNADITEVSLTIVSRFNGANFVGALAGGIYPVNAIRDSLFGNTELFGTLENITPVFKLSGLNPSQDHDLSFFASRMDSVENRTTRYTVTGATTAFTELDASNNVTNTATLTGVKPDAAGEITIALTPGASNNTANHFTYLGVLKVTPQASTGDPVLLPPVISNGQILLNWTGTGTLEWSTSLIQGSWQAYNPAPQPPFSEAIVPGQRKFFRIRP